jgi:hypothetical protein
MALASAVSQAPPTSAASQHAADAPATKPRWTTNRALVLLLIVFIANLVTIAMIVSRGELAPARPQVSVQPVPAARPAPDPAPVLPSSFGEGRFVVSTDIAPGTYQTAGKAGRFDCYWERLKDTSGTSESIIANDLAPGPATVTIDKTDGAFQTRWCRPWTRVN